MKYIKTIYEFINESISDKLTLISIKEDGSLFGTSYYSKYVRGDHKFLTIQSSINGSVGEIEYGIVDNDTVEIVSVFIRKEFRGGKYGKSTLNEFKRILKNPKIILKVTPQSKSFWTHMGFRPMSGTKDYYALE